MSKGHLDARKSYLQKTVFLVIARLSHSDISWGSLHILNSLEKHILGFEKLNLGRRQMKLSSILLIIVFALVAGLAGGFASGWIFMAKSVVTSISYHMSNLYSLE